MNESTLKFIKCPKRNGIVDLEIYENKKEIIEGILKCDKCELVFPIIDKIPIMLKDFKKYISEHRILSGKIYRLASSKEVKKFLKSTLDGIIWEIFLLLYLRLICIFFRLKFDVQKYIF
jgi:uncharacterized protein YbaR (Trm112 family)